MFSLDDTFGSRERKWHVSGVLVVYLPVIADFLALNDKTGFSMCIFYISLNKSLLFFSWNLKLAAGVELNFHFLKHSGGVKCWRMKRGWFLSKTWIAFIHTEHAPRLRVISNSWKWKHAPMWSVSENFHFFPPFSFHWFVTLKAHMRPFYWGVNLLEAVERF